MGMAEMIGVTGVTGAVGSRVAHRLAEAGVRQRLVLRDPARAPDLPGAEVAEPASYGEKDALRRAFDGISTLFLVSGSESADRVREHTATVDAAVDAGVARIVYLSFVGAAPDCTFTFARDHWHTEQHIRETGAAFSFLRDSIYLAMLPIFTSSDGAIRGPAGDGRVAAVAHDDVADVAAAVLLDTSHGGRTYDVTGPEAFSLDEAAEAIGRAAGRPVRYVRETVEEAYASRATYGAPAFEVAGWVTTYQAIAAGELDVVSDTVERIAGHEPQGLAEYLAAHPESCQHLMSNGRHTPQG